MHIFRLTPVDLGDEDWATSAWFRAVIVRAGNERFARLAAGTAFGVAPARLGRRNRILMSPWSQRHLVSAERLPHSGAWAAYGPTAILDPLQESEVAARIAGLAPEWWVDGPAVGAGPLQAAARRDSAVRAATGSQGQGWWSRLLAARGRAAFHMFAIANVTDAIQTGYLAMR